MTRRKSKAKSHAENLDEIEETKRRLKALNVQLRLIEIRKARQQWKPS